MISMEYLPERYKHHKDRDTTCPRNMRSFSLSFPVGSVSLAYLASCANTGVFVDSGEPNEKVDVVRVRYRERDWDWRVRAR